MQQVIAKLKTIFLEPFTHEKRNLAYSVAILRVFSLNELGLFFPIYLYKAGLSVEWIIGLKLITCVQNGLLFAFGYYLNSKIGTRLLMWATTPCLIIFLLFLIFLDQSYFQNPLIVYGLSSLSGLAAVGFWNWHHTTMAASTTDDNRSNQLNMTYTLLAAWGVVTPLFGALLIWLGGFGLFYGVLLLTAIVASILLYFDEPVDTKVQPSWQWQRFFNHLRALNNVKLMFDGIHAALQEIWKLFLFIILIPVILGYSVIIAVAKLCEIFVGSFVGEAVNSKPHQTIRMSAGLCWFVWSVALFLPSTIAAIGGQVFLRTAGRALENAYDTAFIQNASRLNKSGQTMPVDYFAAAEIILHCGRFVTNLLFLLLFVAVSGNWQLAMLGVGLLWLAGVVIRLQPKF